MNETIYQNSETRFKLDLAEEISGL